MTKILKFVKIAVALAVIYLIAAIGWQFISMQIKMMNVRGDLEEVLYGEVRSDEYEVRDKIALKLDSMNVVPEKGEILVTKPDENSVIIKFAYTDSVTVPVIKKSFYFVKQIESSVKRR